MSTSRNRGSIAAAGIGLLALLIVVALLFWMFTMTAEQSHKGGRKALRDIEVIQEQVQKQGEAINKAAEEHNRAVEQAVDRPSEPQAPPRPAGGETPQPAEQAQPQADATNQAQPQADPDGTTLRALVPGRPRITIPSRPSIPELED